ncbi:MAG TPA: hypothetical protein VIM51_08155 [Desulfosporosinus sp.]
MYGMGYGGMSAACCPHPVAPVAHGCCGVGVGAGVGVGIIAVAILILIALGVIF